ncbi:hypothetical protein CHUAL_009164 [Chamberlinius hualienensis]
MQVTFQCGYCDTRAPTFKKVKDHVIKLHSPGSMDRYPFEELHVEDNIPGLPSYMGQGNQAQQCPHCPRLFSNRGMDQHIRQHHPGACLAAPPSPVGPLGHPSSAPGSPPPVVLINSPAPLGSPGSVAGPSDVAAVVAGVHRPEPASPVSSSGSSSSSEFVPSRGRRGSMEEPAYFEMAIDDLELEGQLTTDLDPHPCPHCNRLFSRKGLPRHVRHHHPGMCLANPPSPIGPLQAQVIASPVSAETPVECSAEPPLSTHSSSSSPIDDSSLGISWSPGTSRTTFSSVSSPGLPLIWMQLSAADSPPQSPADLEPTWHSDMPDWTQLDAEPTLDLLPPPDCSPTSGLMDGLISSVLSWALPDDDNGPPVWPPPDLEAQGKEMLLFPFIVGSLGGRGKENERLLQGVESFSTLCSLDEKLGHKISTLNISVDTLNSYL